MYYDLVQSGDYPPAMGKKQEKEENVIHGMIAEVKTDLKKMQQTMGAQFVAAVKTIKASDNNSSNDNSSNKTTNNRVKKPLDPWRLEPPKDGEPLIKDVDGKSYKYCQKCLKGKGLWTTAKFLHSTEEHRDPKNTDKDDSENKANMADCNITKENAFDAYESEVPINELDFGFGANHAFVIHEEDDVVINEEIEYDEDSPDLFGQPIHDPDNKSPKVQFCQRSTLIPTKATKIHNESLFTVVKRAG